MKKILLFILFYSFSNSITAQCYEEITFGGTHTTAQKADGSLWWGYGFWIGTIKCEHLLEVAKRAV